MITPEQQKSPKGHVLMRQFYSHASQAFIPTEIIHEGNQDGMTGSEKAKKLLKKGRGLVIIYTHPSRPDTHRLMGLWKDREYAEPQCLIPIAVHQFNLAAKISAWPAGIEFHPIVTQETVNRGKNKGREVNYGSRAFLHRAVEALGQGSIILLAPTTTRTPVLTMPQGPLTPTDALLDAANRAHVPFALMSTGFEINRVTEYEKANGFNLFRNRRYTLRTGNTYTDSEILEQLETFKAERSLTSDPKKPFNGTDLWLFETQLPSLVPPAYRPAA